MSGYDVTYSVYLDRGRWVIERNGRVIASCTRQERAIRFAAVAAITTQVKGLNATFRVAGENEAKPLTASFTDVDVSTGALQPGL